MDGGIYAIGGAIVGACASLIATRMQIAFDRERRAEDRAAAKIDMLLHLSIQNYDVANDLLTDMINHSSNQPNAIAQVALTDEVRRKVLANESAMRAISRTIKNPEVRAAIDRCGAATREILDHRALGQIRAMRDAYHALWEVLADY